jgi:hypothetical protein
VRNALYFFQATPGGRNVIEKFIKSDLKNLRDARGQLVDQLEILERTPISIMREMRRIEHVADEIFSFRFRTSDHWIRLLIAFSPKDDSIVVLLPLIKKRNRIDSDDLDQAKKNLRLYMAQPLSSA